MLAVYLAAIEQAQAMDRADLRGRAAEELETERIAGRVVAALGKVGDSILDDGRGGITSPQPQVNPDEHVAVVGRIDQRRLGQPSLDLD